MLGRGLESLIPPKNNGSAGVPNDAANLTPDPSQGQPSPVPWYPKLDPIQPELPAEPELPELPAEPELPELPAEPERLELSARPEVAELPTEAEILQEPPAIDPPFSSDISDRPDGSSPGGSIYPEAAKAAAIKPAVYADVERAALERTAEAVFHIEVERIHPNPYQPRRNFDEEAIHDLAASIREFGILQPLVVRKIEKETPTGTAVEYELIAGERRWLAAKYLGLEFVPAIIRRVDAERERLEMAIIENLQRENLNPIEMARAFAELQDQFRMTQREIATRLGKSRETVANTVRLLDLPQAIQDAIGRGEISESHGRLLLAVPDLRAQEALFHDLVDRHLTTRELRHRVESLAPVSGTTSGRRGRPPGTGESSSPELRDIQHRLSAELGAPVKIMSSVSGESGKITITFYSKEELEGILERLRAGETI